MKVSVIMPVYNGGEYLRPMLESVLHQTLTEIELCAVDDGSTDGSDDVLREIAEKDSRVKARFNKHQGVGTAVKTARGMATGDYIMYCDDDDILLPHALERLYLASEGVADAVKGTALVEKGDKIWQGNKFQSGPLDWREMDAEMLCRHFLQVPEVWSYIFKRELMEDIYTGDYMFGDTDTVFKAKAKAKDFRYIPDPVYCWRVHPSASNSAKFPFDIIKVYDNLEQWLKERNINLWPVFGKSKFNAYLWNLSRISDEDKVEFMEYFKRDMGRENTILLTEEEKAMIS